MDFHATPGWQYAAFAFLLLVVVANYVREQRAKARPALVVVEAEPVPAHEQCSVDGCGKRHTKSRHGWRFCDDDYEQYVNAPRPRIPA